jgi:gamma-glutamylputrescine oxidase
MRRTRYGVSPWVDAFPASRRPAFPRFRADPNELTVPVVIVGGGLTGCCTAYALAAAGVPAVVFEADRLGVVGAGRAPGVASGEPCPSFHDLQARHGRRAARAMFDASRRAVLDLGATIRRLGIRANFAVLDALRAGVPESAMKALLRETADRREAGLDASWVKGAALVRWSRVEAAGGMRMRGWAHVDPYRLALGFARAAGARGARFFERSPVTRIKSRRKSIEIRVHGSILTAQTVIVCTGEPTTLFRALARHFRVEHQYVAMTAPMSAAMRKQLGAELILTDAEVPPHRVWQTDDHRFIVAGGDQARTPERGLEKVLRQRTGQLMYELSRLFPTMSGLPAEFGWHVPVAHTADRAMYCGPHRNYPAHLFAWGTEHDPARAFLASRILVRHILNTTEKDDLYFAFTRG